jgi:hypothetical protein
MFESLLSVVDHFDAARVLAMLAASSTFFAAIGGAAWILSRFIENRRAFRAEQLMRRLLGSDAADEVLGDLEEVCLRDEAMHGRSYALRHYRRALAILIAKRLWRSALRLAFRQRA